MDFDTQDLTKIVEVLIRIAPGAGLMITAAVCFRISGDTLGGVLTGLAALLWGWKKK
jgi:hypothetical protein